MYIGCDKEMRMYDEGAIALSTSPNQKAVCHSKPTHTRTRQEA